MSGEKSVDTGGREIDEGTLERTQEMFNVSSWVQNYEGKNQNTSDRLSRNANSWALNSDLHTISMEKNTISMEKNLAAEHSHTTYEGDQEKVISSEIKPDLPSFDVLPTEIKTKMWGDISYESFFKLINGIYDEVVHFWRNIFNIPSGRSGKSFIEEITLWIKQFNSNSVLDSVALEAFMVLPSLILQKLSATSKSKEHSVAIIH
jgi:hypothetical protein